MEHVTWDAAYSSDLSRAEETARILTAPKPGLDLRIDQDLREMHLGAWEGLSPQALADAHGDSRREWLETPEVCRIPGGESLADVQARMVACLDRILASHPEEATVLVVSHGYALLSWIVHFLGLPMPAFRKLWLDAAGLTVVTRHNGQMHLRRLNDTAHLKGSPSP